MFFFYKKSRSNNNSSKQSGFVVHIEAVRPTEIESLFFSFVGALERNRNYRFRVYVSLYRRFCYHCMVVNVVFNNCRILLKWQILYFIYDSCIFSFIKRSLVITYWRAPYRVQKNGRYFYVLIISYRT